MHTQLPPWGRLSKQELGHAKREAQSIHQRVCENLERENFAAIIETCRTEIQQLDEDEDENENKVTVAMWRYLLAYALYQQQQEAIALNEIERVFSACPHFLRRNVASLYTACYLAWRNQITKPTRNPTAL